MKDIWNDAHGHWHMLPANYIAPENLPWTPTGQPLYAVTTPGHITGVGRTPEEAIRESQSEPRTASTCGICGKKVEEVPT